LQKLLQKRILSQQIFATEEIHAKAGISVLLQNLILLQQANFLAACLDIGAGLFQRYPRLEIVCITPHRGTLFAFSSNSWRQKRHDPENSYDNEQPHSKLSGKLASIDFVPIGHVLATAM
jgi:hypothetical protein